MSSQLLKLTNICKDFSGVTVLENVDLELEEGRVYGMAGENGAGKSTMCNIIAGNLQPSSGAITLGGKEYMSLTVDLAKKLGVRMVHQEIQVLPELSIAENIFVGSEVQSNGWIKKKEMYARATKILSMVGLDIDPRTPVKKIDIAARQLIEIARASSVDAKLIIMDEPTSSLSEKETNNLFQIIRKYKKQGITFIFISHRLEELIEISDEIIVLKDGKMVAKRYPGDTTEDEIISLMVGRNYADFYERKRTCFGEEALRVENISGRSRENYSNAYMPQNISFSVDSGEVLGIAGLVGAGRTELVKLLFGVDPKAENGTVYINGKKTNIRNSRDAKEHGMVWVTEDRKNEGLILDFSIKTNIAIPQIDVLRKHGIFADTCREKLIANDYIERLKIKTESIDKPVKFLSGGNQQKVVMSKWLATNPRILVLDEPTRGIDVGAKAEIYKLINSLTDEGIAVLVISSELPEIMGISDRVIIIHEGRLVGEVNRDEFSEELIMTYATGRKKNNEYEKN